MGFTKLDDGILQSSVMAADPVTFKVWIALLAAAKSDGMVPVAPTYLAAVCHLSIEEVRQALHELESPDQDSRSPEHEGRRIERVDGGWFLVNYAKYRKRAESEEHKTYEREKKRRQREASRDVPEVSGTDAGRSASPSYSASVSVGEGSGEREDDRGARLLHESRVAKERRFYAFVSRLAELQPEKDPPDIARELTGYTTKDGRKVRGVVRPETLTEERLDRSLEDAQWWVDELTKPKEAQRGA